VVGFAMGEKENNGTVVTRLGFERKIRREHK
jgi:hypothetical protein